MANSRDTILNLFPDNNNNEITASKIRQFVTAIFNEEIDINEIQDRLTSTDTDKPLSANQGRVLDEKIDTLESTVDSKENTLPNGNAEDILSLDVNGDKIWIAPTIFNETVVYDDLDSTSDTDALSANQGRVLDAKITTQDNINTAQDGLIAGIETDLGILDGRVTQNTTDISQNAVNISTNTDDIASNVIRINDNRTDIVSLNSTVTDHSGYIVTATNEIIAVNSRVDTTNANVSQNANDISLNTISISSVGSRTTILEGLVQGVNCLVVQTKANANEGAINVLDATVNGHTSLINANTTAIGVNAGAIVTNTSSVNLLDGRVEQNEDDIVLLQAQDGIIDGQITGLDGRVTQNEADIAQHTIDIGNNTTAIDINADNITENTDGINTNTTDIGTLQTDLGTESARIDAVESENTSQSALIENNRLDTVRLGEDLENTDTSLAQVEVVVAGKENSLGTPTSNNQVLASLTDGTRMWITNESGGASISVINTLNEIGNTTDALSANMGYILDQKVITKEEFLGLPILDDMMLISTSAGVRSWVDPSVLRVDYGEFFGADNRIVSVSVIPNTGTYYASVPNIQLTATATRDLGQLQNITTVATWLSDNTSVATVNGAGTVVPTDNAYGVVNVTATIDDGSGSLGIVGLSTITIAQVLIDSILITPSDLIIGQNIFIPYVATATYNNGTTEDVTDLGQWSINDGNLAVINNIAPNKGEAQTNNSLQTGTAVVTFVVDDGSGSNDITSTTNLSVTTS